MNSDSVGNNGFDLDIDKNEHLMIRLGRLLYSKLGKKNFIFFHIIIIGVPVAIFIYALYLARENPQIILNNFLIIFISLVVAAFFLVVLSYGKISYCKYCERPYATIPLQRKLMGKTEYKNGELYKIRQYRRCEYCRNVTTEDYTEEYSKDSRDD